jgi:hypothetical protein
LLPGATTGMMSMSEVQRVVEWDRRRVGLFIYHLLRARG